jgi:uncharacterized membrane protein required for colicin V production
MVLAIFSQFNFLDIIILIVLFRICYIAAQTGLSIEIFKFLGVIFSTFISLHYYTSITDLIRRSFIPKEMPLEFLDFIVFILLIIIVYLIFVGIRGLLSRFVQLDAVPKINKFTGLLLGLGRAYLITGLMVFTLAISSVSYLQDSVKSSYLGSRAFMVAPRTYDFLWSNIFSKFNPKEEFNPVVSEVMAKFGRK